MRTRFSAVPIALAILGLSACSPGEDAEPVVNTYQLGERVPTGHLIYTVFERQWMPQIGYGVDARIPQNRFYQVRVSVVNSGGASLLLPTIALIDDAGTSYSEIKNGDGIADFLGALHELAPAESVQGNLVFDVPPKHYKLKLTDENGKSAAVVDLPLSFDSGAPDLTMPGDALRDDATKK